MAAAHTRGANRHLVSMIVATVIEQAETTEDAERELMMLTASLIGNCWGVA